MTTAKAPRVEPLSDPGPSRHPITVGEYFRMGESGVLDPDALTDAVLP